MNRRTMMSPREINNATFNIRQIEKALGHPIPPGYFDATNYNDRFLSSGEAYTIANDIRRVEHARHFDQPKSNSYLSQGSDCLDGLGFLFGVIYLIFAGIAHLFKR